MHVVHVSTLPPTRCGIAQYTSDLARAIAAVSPRTRQTSLRLDFSTAGLRVSPDGLNVDPCDALAMQRAAEQINQLQDAVVLLQHEYKIFGGENGENVLALVGHLRTPLVSTLHTASLPSSPVRRRIRQQLVERSARVLLFHSQLPGEPLPNDGCDSKKLAVIPHGVPEVPFLSRGPELTRESPGTGFRIITPGLVRPTKGIDVALEALSLVANEHGGSFRYAVCGAPHPRDPAASRYLDWLRTLVDDYDLQGKVHFTNRHLDSRSYSSALVDCDLGLLPYTRRDQTSSGVLCQLLACGRPVLATDFACARNLIDAEVGSLVPVGDSRAMANELARLMKSPEGCAHMGRTAFDRSRTWIWPVVAERHVALLSDCVIHA